MPALNFKPLSLILRMQIGLIQHFDCMGSCRFETWREWLGIPYSL
jgi:hypothetical protein